VLVLEGGTCAARSGTRCQRGRHDAPSQPEPTLLRCGLATVCRRRGSVVSRPHKDTATTRTTTRTGRHWRRRLRGDAKGLL